MIEESSGINDADKQRPSVMESCLMTPADQRKRAKRRADQIAHLARTNARKSFVRQKRREMSEVPPVPSLSVQIDSCILKLKSCRLVEVLSGVLHLTKHLSEEVEQSILESRISACVEAGVARQVGILLRFEPALAEEENCLLYDSAENLLEGTLD